MSGFRPSNQHAKRSFHDEDRSFVAEMKAKHQQIQKRYVKLEDSYDELSYATRRDLHRSGVFARFACRVVLGLHEDADHFHLLKPLLDEWCDTGVALSDLITHVVVHEVGHHFGLSDDDMHALEDAVT